MRTWHMHRARHHYRNVHVVFLCPSSQSSKFEFILGNSREAIYKTFNTGNFPAMN